MTTPKRAQNMFAPDDEDDFTPAGNSNLASLFGQPMEDGNASLTYTAPKQPKKNRTETTTSTNASPTKLTIIAVEAVQTYRLEGATYVNQGKLGAALLGNPASKSYQLLLYKTKQQHITSTKIIDKFQYTVQPQNYASFYDDKGQNWSIMFDNENGAVGFAREVGLARACAVSDKEEQPFYVQDLRVGEGPGVAVGDLLEIRYTALPLVNGKLEKALESNLDAEKPQRVSVRKGVWEEALIGANKGCKKLIVLAPSLFGPWKPLANAEHRLVVEVEVGRIKAKKQSREGSPFNVVHHPDSSESNIDSSTDETSIKARGASISEALSNSPKTHKASLISRMARMGQATLPLKGAVVCNPSDSEETEEETVASGPKAALAGKSALKSRPSSKRLNSPHHSPPVSTTAQEKAPTISAPTAASSSRLSSSSNAPTQQVTVYQPAPFAWQGQNQPSQYLINGVPVNYASHSDNQLYSTPHQVVPIPAVLPGSGSISSSDSQLAVYFSENRTHNAEVRMGLTKVADKVDQVLGKLDTLQQSPIGVLDPRTLLASIQKLVIENEQMQAELTDKRVKMEQQNEKIYQLLNQKFLEQSSTANPADQRPDLSFQVVLLGLQQEKAKLSTDLNEALVKNNTLQVQVANFERVNNELREEVESLTSRLKATFVELECSKQALIEHESLMRSLKEKTDASVNLHDTQDSVIKDLEVKVRNLNDTKTLLEKALMESKQQFEQERMKLAEEIVLINKSHKEELKELEQRCRDKVDEPLKGEVICGGNNCQHIIESQKLNKENEELRLQLSNLKDQISTIQLSSVADVKKVMNVMYKLLKSEFKPESTYDGSAIRETILSSIQDVMLQYMQMKSKISTESKPGLINPNGEVHKVSKLQKNPDGNEQIDANPETLSEPIQKPKNEKLDTIEKGSERTGENEHTHNEVKGLEAIAPKDDISEVKIDVNIEETTLKTKTDPEQSSEPSTKEQTLDVNVQDVQQRDSSVERGWRPQPPPPPLFDDEEDDDDWLS